MLLDVIMGAVIVLVSVVIGYSLAVVSHPAPKHEGARKYPTTTDLADYISNKEKKGSN